jgi:hypothetical protein
VRAWGAAFGQLFVEMERRLALYGPEKRGEVVKMLRNGGGIDPDVDAAE